MKNNRKIWRKLLLFALALLFVGGISMTAAQPETVSAAVENGWEQVGDNWCYYQNGTKVKKQWVEYQGKWYYLKSRTGAMATKMFISWKGQKYYVNKSGVMVTGWKYISRRWYYFNKTSGVMQTGWLKLSSGRFYMGKNGKMYKPGWHTIKGKKYYMSDSGAVVTGKVTMNGKVYTFSSTGALKKTTVSKKNRLQTATSARTLRNYLLNALRPVGKTYYDLGGGHGTSGMTKSVPTGLDCSGYVAWSTYQVLGNKYFGGDYSAVSYQIFDKYKNGGLGTVKKQSSIAKGGYKGKFKAGDIVGYQQGSTGHVWIVIGQCSDGSYVLVHTAGSGSLPNSSGCTQIAGTPAPDGSQYGNGNSEAIRLANRYMQKYHLATMQKKGMTAIITATDLYSYFQNSSLKRFRFSSTVMRDPDSYKSKTAAQILKDLYGES